MFNMSAGGEVANAQVCKTCTRGFDSRSALQNFSRKVFPVADKDKQQKFRISLDTYAVIIALGLALLVRLNWIPAVKW